MQVEAAVRLAAMQKDGYGHNGDMREHQGDKRNLPPRQLKKASGQIRKDLVHIG